MPNCPAALQLHLHTALALQPFLLLLTASSQPGLCRGVPDPAKCLWQTVSLQVRRLFMLSASRQSHRFRGI